MSRLNWQSRKGYENQCTTQACMLLGTCVQPVVACGTQATTFRLQGRLLQGRLYLRA